MFLKSYLTFIIVDTITILKYLLLVSLLTNQNSIHVEIKCRSKAGNSCYYSVQTLLSSRLLSKILKIKMPLLIETKPIVCLPWEILHYKISREKLEPEPGFEPRTSGFLARLRARNPEVRGSNPGSGSSFSLEIL